jgi:crotonobetainyl-CoA:carnitine CoA-transferase CaiB-like acyl-CoA transferase
MTPPLAGYRVLELAHLIAEPVCGMNLADMSADVVKIEQPSGGDASRTTDGTHFGGGWRDWRRTTCSALR